MSNVQSDLDRRFFAGVMNQPMLTYEQEQKLARAAKQGDEWAREKLVKAHLRMALSTASLYSRRFGLSCEDLFQAGAVGLMKAVDRFEPERGFRLSTFASWWIRASVQEEVLTRNVVKLGSSPAMKTLFFNLKLVKNQLEAAAARKGISLSSEELMQGIAEELNVSLRSVEQAFLYHSDSDVSLNSPVGGAGEEGGSERLEFIPDVRTPVDQAVQQQEDRPRAQAALREALARLDPRQRYIIEQRYLSPECKTLDKLAEELEISQERVRQIQVAALKKLKKWLWHSAAHELFV